MWKSIEECVREKILSDICIHAYFLRICALFILEHIRHMRHNNITCVLHHIYSIHSCLQHTLEHPFSILCCASGPGSAAHPTGHARWGIGMAR